MYINYFIKELELLNKRIFFSREHNIMFLTTPKCGSQFIKSFCLSNFTKYITDNENREFNFREWSNDNTVTIEDLNNSDIKKYQIVRDPYKRLISFVSSNLDKPENIGKKEDKLFTEQYLLRSIIKSIKGPHPVKIPTNGVLPNKEKISFLYDGYLSLYEHLFPQHDWLFSKYFQPIKLEDLDEFLKDSPNYIIPKKQNFNHHTKYIFESKLDKKTKDKIYEIYRDDFVKFNYKK